MQVKDIPDQPILDFLEQVGRGCTFIGFPNSVANAMPPRVNVKLVMAKMKTMIRKGQVTGCACGCRGDYQVALKSKEN